MEKIATAKNILLFCWQLTIAYASFCQCRFNNDSAADDLLAENMVNCYCSSVERNQLIDVPDSVNVLEIKKSDIKILNSQLFSNMKQSLVDVSLLYLDELEYIDGDTFTSCQRLRSIYISHCPKLRSIGNDALIFHGNKLKVLQITKTGLESISKLQTKHGQILHTVDLENNKLSILESNSVQVEADHVIFDYNTIREIKGWAFNKSKIYKLSLKGNRNLEKLSEHAFRGLENLQVLDLSATSIASLPAYGIDDIETIIVRNTHSLKTIPSIYDFQKLKQAYLTHSFHCCAFRLPELHDFERYVEHKAHVLYMKRLCGDFGISGGTTQSATIALASSSDRLTSDEEMWHDAPNVAVDGTSVNGTEHFHQIPIDMTNKTDLLAICGPFFIEKEAAKCDPLPGPFNPCEDIMGYEWLRSSVWLVVCTGLFGNLCVLATIVSNHKELTVQSFLIGNLAFSDLCMAVYLLMLAVQDVISKGFYFNYAFDWQEGIGCKIAGMLTIFSSQLSIFILCLLTIERWFSIKRALYLNKMGFRTTVLITTVGWLYAVIMSVLPLFGISSYSTTSLCLPMTIENAMDVIYISLLLLFSSVSFVVICVCYYQIYFSLSYETRRRHKDGEHRLARKIGTLVATNFLCLAPITFFATSAVIGYPLISITNSKVLLVFFYPINSCADPFLYAILTSSFKRDFVHLLSRFGICKKYDRRNKLIHTARNAATNLRRLTLSTSQTS